MGALSPIPFYCHGSLLPVPHLQPVGQSALRHLRAGCLRQAPTTGRLPRSQAWIEGPSHLAALVEPDAGEQAAELKRNGRPGVAPVPWSLCSFGFT